MSRIDLPKYELPTSRVSASAGAQIGSFMSLFAQFEGASLVDDGAEVGADSEVEGVPLGEVVVVAAVEAVVPVVGVGRDIVVRTPLIVVCISPPVGAVVVAEVVSRLKMKGLALTREPSSIETRNERVKAMIKTEYPRECEGKVRVDTE
jgi:hypothetical protein